MFARLGSIAVAVWLLGLAGPASAQVSGECLWTHLPKARADGLLAAYRKDGLPGLKIESGDFAGAKACGASLADDKGAGQTLAYVVVEKAAEAALLEESSVPKGGLEKAWRGLTVPDRQTVQVGSHAANQGDFSKMAAVRPIAIAMQVGLGLADAPLNDHVVTFLLARSLRDAGEAAR